MQEGVCDFSGERVFHNNKHRCHSNTDAMPSYFLALAGSIRVHYSLLDVRMADEGGRCVNCGGQVQSVLV